MMKHRGSELAPLGTFEKQGAGRRRWPRSKAKEKAIHDGKFTVKVNDAEPESRR